MIPLRISLRGFLCYKDEQEVSFDSNATLWMLSGLNGSGKSSIFDAVTYALFGHHRGGSQHAVELINKDSDGLSVEFDFRLDSQVYRVRRTLRRTAKGSSSSTQQIYRYQPPPSPPPHGGGKEGGDWVAVEGSNYKQQFTDWISDKIGLTYETFTSSVLLLQGKAEKLLGSKPEERRAVLASIVDLERYERLYEKADAKRKELKGKLEGLSDRLAALPEVKPEQVAAAEEAIRLAEESRKQASDEVDRLRQLEVRAREWMDLRGKLATARQRCQHAEQLLEKAADIERDLERLRELRQVLPHLREIIKQRGTIRDAELTSKELLQQKEKTTEQSTRLENALAQERNKRTTLRKQIEEEEKRLGPAIAQRDDATAQMAKLTEYERHACELESIRKELVLLPANPSEELNRARAVCDGLAALIQLLPQLARFREHREGLRQAKAREQETKQRLDQIEARGKQLNTELKRLEPLVQATDRVARQAKDQETEARTLLKQAREGLQEITQMEGSKRCRHCGQELTPGHVEEEKLRRSEEVQRCEEHLKKAAADLAAAREEENRLREEARLTQENYREAREEYREAQSQAQQAGADIVRLQNECGRAYTELPERQRQLISAAPPSDWLKTDYPRSQDMDKLRAEAAEYEAACLRRQKVEDVLQKWNKLKTQEDGKLVTLTRLQAELPKDREAVRQKYNDLKLTLHTLESNLKTKRDQTKGNEAEIERLTRERQREQEYLNHIDLQLGNKELERKHARQTIAVNQKALPALWQPVAESAGTAEYNEWDKERADLDASGIERRSEELQQARIKRDENRRDVVDLEARQQDFAAEARCNPADIKAGLEQAKEAEKMRKDDLNSAERKLGLLRGYQEQREQIGADYIRLEGELSRYKTVAELLGKNKLQLHLVRQAEKEVVEYANAVLDRLSGGQLYLKLRGEIEGESSSDRALDLEAYNRITGERPINVAFLSGSQKFRVAVSLALGIGQYASRQHRPIESVIIDEGFGCLDSQGRQVMIQELQNLRSQMRCILLVSHQEDFAEAFPDGYRFELEAGATRIKRFQK